MSIRSSWVLLICLPLFGACARQKSTQELISDLKSPDDKDRIIAVRTLPGKKKGDAAEIVPALIEALKDADGDVRRSAAIKLGSFGDKAKDAIPVLQAALHDKDARVRESAGMALSRIDPKLAPKDGAGKGRGR